MDNENLGFSRERSKLPVRIMSDNIDELTWKIASDYPKWLTSNFMPFLSLKTDASGRASLCVPFLNVKLLTFSPLRRARKGGGWWYRVEGGLLADRPESGTLAFDLRAPFSLAGTGDKIVPGEFRTRLDGFRSRIAGTPAPLSKAIREHERSKSLFSTKKPPTTVAEALSLKVPPGVEPQPWRPSPLSNLRRYAYQQTQMRLHHLCMRSFHKYTAQRLGPQHALQPPPHTVQHRLPSRLGVR